MSRHGVLMYAQGTNGPLVVRMPDTFVLLDEYDADEAPLAAWIPAEGQRWRLQGFTIVGSEDGTYLFQDDDGENPVTKFILPITSNTPASFGGDSRFALGNGIEGAAPGNVLRIIGPSNSTVSGTLYGQGGGAAEVAEP